MAKKALFAVYYMLAKISSKPRVFKHKYENIAFNEFWLLFSVKISTSFPPLTLYVQYIMHERKFNSSKIIEFFSQYHRAILLVVL